MSYPPKTHQQNTKDVMRKRGPRSRICAGKTESAAGKILLGCSAVDSKRALLWESRSFRKKVNVRGVVVYRVDEKTDETATVGC
jgi:hypothetical protein